MPRVAREGDARARTRHVVHACARNARVCIAMMIFARRTREISAVMRERARR